MSDFLRYVSNGHSQKEKEPAIATVGLNKFFLYFAFQPRIAA